MCPWLTLTKSIVATAVTTPHGKLIQKHHLQETFVVSAPPINGAVIEAVMKAALPQVSYIALFRRGTRRVRILFCALSRSKWYSMKAMHLHSIASVNACCSDTSNCSAKYEYGRARRSGTKNRTGFEYKNSRQICLLKCEEAVCLAPRKLTQA